MYPQFEQDIAAMNARYELANIEVKSWFEVVKRLEQFKDILDKEFTELDDIQVKALAADDSNWGTGEGTRLPIDVVVGLADLLGDIIVYCASEGYRWGIPMPYILMIIMASNTSKLGADGKPIKNPENGKFEKGPNYWKPEPAIEFLLTSTSEHGITFHRNEAGVVSLEFKYPDKPDVDISEAGAILGDGAVGPTSPTIGTGDDNEG